MFPDLAHTARLTQDTHNRIGIMRVQHPNLGATLRNGLGECAWVNDVITHVQVTHHGNDMLNDALRLIKFDRYRLKCFSFHVPLKKKRPAREGGAQNAAAVKLWRTLEGG